MLFDMLEYCKMLEKNHLNIIYSGPLWMDGVEGIAAILKKRMAYDELPLSASQAVFSVFVEQINNMLMYSADKESPGQPENAFGEASKGTFVLGKMGKTYFLQSGNVMSSDSIDMIRDRIDYLNTLDKPGLRKYYKEMIRQENRNPLSRGAGLGLIEIARRSSSKIEYDFTPLDEDKCFFSMYVEIG